MMNHEKKGAVENFKGKGFHTNPERINRKGRLTADIPPDLKIAMAKLMSEERDGVTRLDKVLQVVVHQAMKGNIKAAQFLVELAYPDHKNTGIIVNQPYLVWGTPSANTNND